MKQIAIFIFVFLGVTILYLITLSLQKIFVLPLTGLIHTIDGLILFLIGLKLRSDLAGTADLAKEYFMYFFLSFGVFQLIMGLAHAVLYINQSAFASVITWGYIIGHIFLYLSLAFTLIVPLELIFPGKKIKNIAFILIALFGLVITYINIIKPNHPVFESKTGLTFFNADPLVGKLIPIIVLLSWGISVLIFIYNGVKSRSNRLAMARSLLISLGLIFLIVGGPLHDVAQTSLQFLMADILTLAGSLILASGTLIKFSAKELPAGQT